MESPMHRVMTAAWDYAPPAVVTSDDDTDDEAEVVPPTPNTVAPSSSSPVDSIGWPVLGCASQRWLIAAIAVLFLGWIWLDDRKDATKAVPPAATAPDPPILTTTTVAPTTPAV